MSDANNKKIAMIGHKRIPSREGGVERVVEKISVRLVERGYNVTCYNRKGHHVSGEQYNSKRVDNYKGVKVRRVITIDKKGLAAMTSSLFASIRAAFGGYDVVHFHAEGPCAVMWIPKLFRKRCVATIHGLDWQRSKWGGFASWYIKHGEKVAVKKADEIIVLSKNMQDYFKETYDRDTVLIPNGVERHRERKPDRIKRKFGLEKDDYILYLSRIVPEKGLIYLVEAFKKLDTDKKLVIAGGISDTEDYAKAVKELASDDERIIFTGFVQGITRKELYDNAYVFVLPSDVEGMPLSLLEAMSYRNCCLTSDIPECTEVVGDKALSFQKGNVKDLRAKLQTLCENPHIVKEYQEQSADYICDKYDWEKVVDETVKLYEGQK